MYGADVVGGSGDRMDDLIAGEWLVGEAEVIVIVLLDAMGTAEVREGSAAASSVPEVV